jgi:hypothetical protein
MIVVRNLNEDSEADYYKCTHVVQEIFVLRIYCNWFLQIFYSIWSQSISVKTLKVRKFSSTLSKQVFFVRNHSEWSIFSVFYRKDVRSCCKCWMKRTFPRSSLSLWLNSIRFLLPTCSRKHIRRSTPDISFNCIKPQAFLLQRRLKR